MDWADTISWSDNLIEIYVPSSDSSITSQSLSSREPMGTGAFRVVTDAGVEAVFDPFIPQTDIIVEYSVKNDSLKEAYVMTPHDSDGEGKLIFHCSTAVANYKNGELKSVIKKAIHDWNCLTAINWELGNDTVINVKARDNVNIIRFGTPTKPNAQMVARTYRGRCGQTAIYMEVDITINQAFDWFCDTLVIDTVIPGEKDAFAAILHELGHAHLLNHVIGIDEIMHYSTGLTSEGHRRIDLLSNNSCSDGGIWVMEFSTNPLDLAATSCANITNITFDTDLLCTSIDFSTA